MKPETPELIRAICVARGFSEDPHQVNSPSLTLTLPEDLGQINVWGHDYTGVFLSWSQDYEAIINIVETEDPIVFVRILDPLLQFIEALILEKVASRAEAPVQREAQGSL